MANRNHRKIHCNFRAGKIFLTLTQIYKPTRKRKKNSHTILLSFFLCLERQAMLSHPWAFVLPQCLADCRLETSVYLKVPKTMRCWPQTNVESGQGLKERGLNSSCGIILMTEDPHSRQRGVLKTVEVKSHSLQAGPTRRHRLRRECEGGAAAERLLQALHSNQESGDSEKTIDCFHLLNTVRNFNLKGMVF